MRALTRNTTHGGSLVTPSSQVPNVFDDTILAIVSARIVMMPNGLSRRPKFRRNADASSSTAD